MPPAEDPSSRGWFKRLVIQRSDPKRAGVPVSPVSPRPLVDVSNKPLPPLPLDADSSSVAEASVSSDAPLPSSSTSFLSIEGLASEMRWDELFGSGEQLLEAAFPDDAVALAPEPSNVDSTVNPVPISASLQTDEAPSPTKAEQATEIPAERDNAPTSPEGTRPQQFGDTSSLDSTLNGEDPDSVSEKPSGADFREATPRGDRAADLDNGRELVPVLTIRPWKTAQELEDAAAIVQWISGGITETV